MRVSWTDPELLELAQRNALNLSTGHTFLILLSNAFPINVLNAVKNVPEVCGIFCATANPVQVIVGETGQGRAILGVVDGFKSQGIETAQDMEERGALSVAAGCT